MMQNELNRELEILGRNTKLSARTKAQLKGIAIGEMLSYNFYDGVYQNVSLLFVEPKKDNPTPKECERMGIKFSAQFGLPIVFILKPGPTYERQRLMDKGVYFVMSNNYACLPTVVAIEKTSNRKEATRLSPVAQFLLLYHLQIKSLEGMTAKEIASFVPYSYSNVTLGLSCMDDLSLCEKRPAGTKSNTIHFSLKHKELWDAAKDYLENPVEQHFFCDAINSDDSYPVCSINALSHYSWLNPDGERMIMMTSKEYRTLKTHKVFENANSFDGSVMVEVWKYPAIKGTDESSEYVDKLSLALSLKDDSDPRVEGEVERMINEIEWKD